MPASNTRPAARKRPGRTSTAIEEVAEARRRLPAVKEAIVEHPERYGVPPEKMPDAKTPDDAAVRTYRAAEQERLAARRVEAMSLRLAGLTWEQIAERIGTTPYVAKELVDVTIARATYSGVDEMRNTENARLDRMQAGVWSLAIQGDMKAIGTMMRIMDLRAKLNGLYAPTKIDLNVGVRTEMETALSELRMTLLGDTFVEDADVVEATPFDDDALDAALEHYEWGEPDDLPGEAPRQARAS